MSVNFIDARKFLMRGSGLESARCNICGGRNFGDGPGGRKSITGNFPLCEQCGSLERHRIIRKVWDCFPIGALRWKTALQFSVDDSIEGKWFLDYEVSCFGGRNSLDLQRIDRPDQSYDIIICNHVFEHVPDEGLAFCETKRILKHHGFLQFSVPSPKTRAATEDWGYPDPEQHGHYRVYGRDVAERIQKLLPEFHLLAVDATDDVTDAEDFVYFGSSDACVLENIGNWCLA